MSTALSNGAENYKKKQRKQLSPVGREGGEERGGFEE